VTKLYDVDTRLKDLEQELSDTKTSQEELLSQLDKRFDILRGQLARKDSQIRQVEAEKEMLKALTGRLFNMIHKSTRDPLADRLRALDDRLKKLLTEEPTTAESGDLSGLAEPPDEHVAEDSSNSGFLGDEQDSRDDVDSGPEELSRETPAPAFATNAVSSHAA